MNQQDKALLADCLTEYIQSKHTQEECIGFIDGFVESVGHFRKEEVSIEKVEPQYPKIYIPWIEIKENTPIPQTKNLLCLRKGTLTCLLYWDGKVWQEDGYDTKQSKTFDDVTHFIMTEHLIRP